MPQNMHTDLYNKNKIMLRFKIINIFHKNGLKQVSENNYLKLLKALNKTLKKNTKSLLIHFLIKNSPFLTVKKVRRKKSKKVIREIPYLIKPKLRIFYALKAIAASIKNNIVFTVKNEIIKLLTKKSSDNLKNIEDSYKNVFFKKSFSHFRWF